MECSKCKEIYMGSTQDLNTRISLHKSNIRITEIRKLDVLKHLYKCSQGEFKIMPIYQTNDYMLLQIKEKKLLMNFSQSWIKHEPYTLIQVDTNIHKYVYIYIRTQKLLIKNNYQ